MSKRAEKRALELFPVDMQMCIDNMGEPYEADVNAPRRKYVAYGYERAEKDLAPAFEFSFDVPDNDGHIVFTPMDNMTIRKELKLKKGERVIVSIRKEHEKE